MNSRNRIRQPFNVNALALAAASEIDGLTIELDQTVGAEAVRFDFDVNFADTARQIPLHLDLTTLGADLTALGLDPVGCGRPDVEAHVGEQLRPV